MIRYIIIILALYSMLLAETSEPSDSLAGKSELADSLTETSAPADSLAEISEPADSLAEPIPCSSWLSADTMLTFGSGYGSFVDVWNELPTLYAAHRGRVGQPAPATSSTPHFTLLYDRLDLQDPVTGHVDLNLVPTESLARITLPGCYLQPDWEHYSANRTVTVQTRDLAEIPMRSRVGYRMGGNGFEDVDVRFGMQLNPKFSFNVGGILKNYGGISVNDKYHSQKVNLKVNRTLFEKWLLQYVLLMNKTDLDLMLPHEQGVAVIDSEFEAELDTLKVPHQKELRYDHGFFLQGPSQWIFGLQFTDLHREFYGYRHTGFDQVIDATRTMGTLQKRFSGLGMQWGLASTTRFTQMNSNLQDQRARWSSDATASVLKHQAFWSLRGAFKVMKTEHESTTLLLAQVVYRLV